MTPYDQLLHKLERRLRLITIGCYFISFGAVIAWLWMMHQMKMGF